jgi:hypothetical protein
LAWQVVILPAPERQPGGHPSVDVLVAQVDSASPTEGEGRPFESGRGHR